MQAVGKFIDEVKLELSKEVWPTKKETVRLTLLVIGISLFVGLLIGFLDIVFVKIVDSLLR